LEIGGDQKILNEYMGTSQLPILKTITKYTGKGERKKRKKEERVYLNTLAPTPNTWHLFLS